MASTEVRNIAGEDDDIVHASWRHEGKHEQGTGSGSCSWIHSKTDLTTFMLSESSRFPPFQRSKKEREGNGIQPQMMPDSRERPTFGRNKRV